MEKSKDKVNFYSLLYIDQNEKHINLKPNFDPISIYLGCGASLQHSMKRFGFSHTILTNDVNRLDEISKKIGLTVSCKEFSFNRFVPPKIRFRSAHYKLDVIKSAGEGNLGNNVCILDLDMLMISSVSSHFLLNGELLGYDISNETYNSYSDNDVLDAFHALGVDVESHRPKWWGGEFISGPAEKFKLLSEVIEKIYPHYCKVANGLFHQGDEMVVSAALDILSKKIGKPVIHDRKIVSRWWSARTSHKPDKLRVSLQHAFLHLPADKNILASRTTRAPTNAIMIMKLIAILAAKAWLRKLINPMLNYRNGEKKFSPRI